MAMSFILGVIAVILSIISLAVGFFAEKEKSC
jgi:hypothetical protein